MRVRWAGVLATLLGICACQVSWAEPCRGSKNLAWARLESKRSQDPEELAREVESFRRTCGLPLNFWAGPKADENQTAPHPCSGVILDFVKSIPSPSDPIMQPEKVFELDPSGEVIKQWWVPVDSVVFGIAGEQLLIPTDIGREERASSVYLAIGPQGDFQVVPFHELSQRNIVDCPKSKNLPTSDSMWCWEIVDKLSGKARRIAYDGPCT